MFLMESTLARGNDVPLHMYLGLNRYSNTGGSHTYSIPLQHSMDMLFPLPTQL